MSSYAGILINDHEVFQYRNEISPEIMSLFAADELVHLSGKDALKIAPRWYADYDEEDLDLYFYELNAKTLRDRLDVVGVGMNLVLREFEGVKAELIQRKTGYLANKSFQDVAASIQAELDDLNQTDFNGWLTSIGQHIKQAGKDQAKQPTGRVENGPLGLFDYIDDRVLLRAISQVMADDETLKLDVTELWDEGWMERESANQELIADWVRRDSMPIVITEGKRDAEVIQAAINLRKSHLSAYIKFLDYDFKNEGSASAAVRTIKSFAAAGVSNRIIVLLDNDSAAYDAAKTLSQIHLPDYYKVLHYPDIEAAKNYPTLGPQGSTVMDVNRLACSIEMYLGMDVLRNKKGELTPVQWKGFMPGIATYQGEILDKNEVNKRFDEKIKAVNRNASTMDEQDWTSLDALLEHLVNELANL